jgi:hypothetical protein
MVEEVGHGPDIHAYMDELRCREVTEVVETHVGCSDSVADPDEERRHVVRTEGGGRLNVRREDEGVVGERPSSLGDPLLDSLAVGSEEGDADGVESDLPGAVGLGALLGEPTRRHDEGPGDIEDADVEVDVGPAERTQLPTAHPRECSQHEQRSKPGIPPFRLFDDLLDDVHGGSRDPAVRHPGRLRPLRDVLSEPSPPHGLVEGSGEDGVDVADGLGRLPGVLQGAVEIVEVLGGELVELDLPEPGTDGPVHLGAVVPDGRRREVEALALLKPAVEKLADRDADAVHASLGVLVHEGSVGCPGAAVEGLRDLVALAGLRVVAEGDPQLPDPCTQLALRSTHDPMVARGCDAFMGWPMGRVAG